MLEADTEIIRHMTYVLIMSYREVAGMEPQHGRHDAGLDIIEASYRLLADAGAFEDVISRWTKRIALVDADDGVRLDHPLLMQHLASVTKLFQEVQPLLNREQVADIATGANLASAVLSREGRVIALNARAKLSWNMRCGQLPAPAWLDSQSARSFGAVLDSARQGTEDCHAVLRAHDEAGNAMLAETYVVPCNDDEDRLVVVRALDFDWTGSVGVILKEAFQLTDAEIDICRLLLDTRDTTQIATRRESSVRTVRTQLGTIFTKTETTTQVDLIRLIAMLCTGVGNVPRNDTVRWIDPLGREKTFTDQNGRRIAYSWMGNPDGRPALLCHGMASTYLLPPEGVQRLKSANVRLFLLSRPGFGNSDPAQREDPLAASAAAIISLAEHLGIGSWPAIGHSAGFPPLVKAAADPRSKLCGLVGVAAYLPYPSAERFADFPPARRIAFRLARNSKRLADFVGRFCHQIVQSQNDEFVKVYMYSDCRADRTALTTPYCKRMIPLARSFMFAHRHLAISADVRMMAVDWTDTLARCPVSIKLLHGEDDPVNKHQMVRQVASSHSHIELSSYPDAGELLVVGHASNVVEALLSQFEGGASRHKI